MSSRARGRACSKCDYFDVIPGGDMAGFCRYSSPVQSWRTQKPGGFGVVNLPWPMVGKDDWCGDFEPAVQAIPKIDIKGG